MKNYFKGNCDANNGNFIARDCNELYECTKDVKPDDITGPVGIEVSQQRAEVNKKGVTPL